MQPTCEHWNKIFLDTESPKLGWYEKDISKTLELLNLIPDWQTSKIFVPGAGTSVLIEDLLSKGASLVLNDISQEALTKLKNILNCNNAKIEWICQDISLPLKYLTQTNIWIDRAVLHFLTEEKDIKGYFDNVKAILKQDGFALFAEFSKDGAPKCAGLPIRKYSVQELSDRLGSSFKLLSYFHFTFINPEGGGETIYICII